MKKQAVLFAAFLIGCSVGLYGQLGMGTGRMIRTSSMVWQVWHGFQAIGMPEPNPYI